MATERLDIIVTERGTNTVRRNLKGVGDSADRTQGAVTLLKRALGALVGGAVVSGLIKLADSFTSVQNRLRTVTKGTSELTAVTNALFAASNRTRVSFESTAQIYARLRNATESLGLSQKETIQLTESLSQAAILSGASSEETSRALIQLSQGLEGGVLRAEEFNSILEQTPGILKVIEKSVGPTRGGLRALMLQGGLTSDVIIKAFQDAREELAERFSGSIPTVAQSFTVLRNNVTKLIGEFNKANGITALLSKGILFLGQNLDFAIRGVAALALTVGTVYAAQAVNKAIAATRAFTLALAANPFGAIAIAVVAVVAALSTFSDQIRLSSSGAATLADFFGAAFGEIRAALGALVEFFAPAFSRILAVTEGVFGDITFSFRDVILFIAKGLDQLVNVYASAFRIIVAIFNNLPAALGDIFTRAINGAISVVNEGIGFIAESINSVLSFAGIGGIDAPQLAQIENSFAGAGQSLGDALGGAMQGSFEGFSNATERIFEASEARAQERIKRNAEQESEAARAAKALATPGVRTNRGGAPTTGQTRQANVLQGALRDLEQEAALLSLNAREQERLNVHFQVANRLKRQLSQAEAAALDTGIQNLQLARDNAAIQQVSNRLNQEATVLAAESNLERIQLATTLQLEDQIKRSLTQAEREALDVQVAQNESLRAQSQILSEIRGPQEEFAQTQMALGELLNSGKISIDEYNTALRDSRIAVLEAQTSLEAGFERGLLKIQQQTQDLASIVDGALTNAFKGAESAFVNFVQTGKLDFGGLVDSIIADVARLAFRQTIGGLFGGGGGGGGGAGPRWPHWWDIWRRRRWGRRGPSWGPWWLTRLCEWR